MRKFFSTSVSNSNFKLEQKVLRMNTISQNLIKAEYQVRGATVIRADEIRKEMENGMKYPFKEFVYWNVGNPQNLGQLPISFPREVNQSFM